jgi:hypothetical protein
MKDGEVLENGCVFHRRTHTVPLDGDEIARRELNGSGVYSPGADPNGRLGVTNNADDDLIKKQKKAKKAIEKLQKKIAKKTKAAYTPTGSGRGPLGDNGTNNLIATKAAEVVILKAKVKEAEKKVRKADHEVDVATFRATEPQTPKELVFNDGKSHPTAITTREISSPATSGTGPAIDQNDMEIERTSAGKVVSISRKVEGTLGSF